MRIQKASLFVFLLFIIVNNSVAQQAAAVDSLKSELAKATTPAEKVTLMDALSRTLMNVSLPQADEYGKQLIIKTNSVNLTCLRFKKGKGLIIIKSRGIELI